VAAVVVHTSMFEEHTKRPVILGSHISTKALKNAAFLLLIAPTM
jgi:hypothetical protein